MAGAMAEVEIVKLREICLMALRHAGLREEGCQAVSTIVTEAEIAGCASHGLFRLSGWCSSLRSGKIDGEALPEVSRVGSSLLRVNANRTVAPLALLSGLPELERSARESGTATMVISDVFHFSALWHEVEWLASRGLVAFAFVNSKSFVAHPGGVQRVYGTNPMAFGFPRLDTTNTDGITFSDEPLVFDQASSAMARGEMQLCHLHGQSLPERAALDTSGRPTTDPAAALAGAQLPFAGHKGAAIALMIELLTAGLSGSPFAFEASEEDAPFNDGGPSRNSETLIAIDPARLWGSQGDIASNLSRVETLFCKILQEPDTRLPSARRYAARKLARQSGKVQIAQSVLDSALNLPH